MRTSRSRRIKIDDDDESSVDDPVVQVDTSDWMSSRPSKATKGRAGDASASPTSTGMSSTPKSSRGRTAHARKMNRSGNRSGVSSSSTGNVRGVRGNSKADHDAQKAAQRKIQHVTVPPAITAPSQLYWHVQTELGGRYSNIETYHPCRICSPDEAVGLADLPDSWDDEEEVLVQYIVFPNVAERMVVPRMDLVPYHGVADSPTKKKRGRRLRRADGSSVAASVGGGGGSWCENMLERYRKQRMAQLRSAEAKEQRQNKKSKSKNKTSSAGGDSRKPNFLVDVHLQCLYLEKILSEVRGTGNGGGTALDSDIDDDDDNNGNGSSHFDDSESEVGGDPSRSNRKEKSRGTNSTKKSKARSKSDRNTSSTTRRGTMYDVDDESEASAQQDEDSDTDDEQGWSQFRDGRIEARKNSPVSHRQNDESSSASSDSDADDALKGDRRQRSKQKATHKSTSGRKEIAKSNDFNSSEEEIDSASWKEYRDNRINARNNGSASDSRGDSSVGGNNDASSSEEEGSSNIRSRFKETTARKQRSRCQDTNDSISLCGDEDDTYEDEGSDRKVPVGKSTRSSSVEILSDDHGDDENEDDDGSMSDGPLDEPYTQALGLDSDDDYVPNFCLEDETSKEPIRPGDVVEYYSHVYVAGDKRGRRVAKVLSVDPNRNPILVLDNGEVIPSDTRIRRMEVVVSGALQKHAGVFRPISNFTLVKAGSAGLAQGLAKEARRVGEVVSRNMAKFEKKARADGFAPMDMMNRYKKYDDKGSRSSKMTPISERRGRDSGSHGTKSSSAAGKSKATLRTSGSTASSNHSANSGNKNCVSFASSRNRRSSEPSTSSEEEEETEDEEPSQSSNEPFGPSSDEPFGKPSSGEYAKRSNLGKPSPKMSIDTTTSSRSKTNSKHKPAISVLETSTTHVDGLTLSSDSESDDERFKMSTAATKCTISGAGRSKTNSKSKSKPAVSVLEKSSTHVDGLTSSSDSESDDEISSFRRNSPRVPKTKVRLPAAATKPINGQAKKRKSPDEKISKRDAWNTSPSKKKHTPATSSKGQRESLSFMDSDDDFEHLSKQKVPRQSHLSPSEIKRNKKGKGSVSKARKESPKRSPADQSMSPCSDEKKDKGGWLGPMNDKKSKKGQTQQKRKRKITNSSSKASIFDSLLTTTATSSSTGFGFSLSRCKK